MKREKTLKQRLMAQFYRKNHLSAAVALGISIPLGLMNLFLSWMIQEIIDTITGVPGAKGLDTIGLMMAAMVATCAMLFLIRREVEPRFIRRAMRQYKALAFEALTEKSAADLLRDGTAGYLSALTNDAATIQQDYLLQLFVFLMDAVMFVGALAMMVYASPLMTAIAVLLALLPLLASVATGGRLEAVQRRVSDRNTAFTASLSDFLSGFSVMKSFRAEAEIRALFEKSNDALEEERYRAQRIKRTVGMIGSLAAITTQMGVFLIGALLAARGYGLTPGRVMLFVNLVGQVIDPIAELPGLLAARRAAAGLVEKLAQTLERHEDDCAAQMLEAVKQGIELEHVSFGYKPGREVLKDVSLTLEAGKAYAVVGASGSGKSTLLGLLDGTLSGYRGHIRMDGVELSDIRRESLTDMISVIQQSVFVFNATIRENVTLFRDFPDEEVEQAMERARLKPVVQRRGDVLCGENGKALSGGERQRISIARSLLKRASVLMADEATAALDAQTAHQVSADLLALAGVTRLVVTHALDESLLRQYDGIVTLKDGRVAEFGTFDELMAKKGYFYALYTVAH